MSGIYRPTQLFRQSCATLCAWFVSLGGSKRLLIQEGFIWGVALLCIWRISRGLSFHRLVTIFEGATLWIFILANAASFFLWWLGDTLLFAILFSFFHGKITFRELLPATAAQYFLQAINIFAADGALVIFLNRRKGVRWLTATWTMMFAGLIDALTLSGIATAAGVLAPNSMMRRVLPFAGSVFGFLILVALWWARGKPITGPERWIYKRPSAHAFRAAGWREYLTLIAIRLSMILIQGFLYYYSIVAFAPRVPLIPVLVLLPAMLAGSNEPFTPQGLGPLQAITVAGLSKFAPRAQILAAALAVSIAAILFRLPLGMGAARTFVRRVLTTEGRKGDGSDADRPDIERQSTVAAR